MNLNIHLHDPEIVSFMEHFQQINMTTSSLLHFEHGWLRITQARGLVEKLNLQELHEWEFEKLQSALGTFQTSLLGDLEIDGALTKEMKSVLDEFFSAESEKGLVKHFDKKMELA